MAITIKYGAPGPILATAFAAGVGHRQNELQDQKLKQWEQQQERQFRTGLQAQAQKFQAGQQEAGFEFRAGENRLDREQRIAEQREQQAFLVEQNTMTGLRRGELQLPPDAEKALRGLESDRVASLELNPLEQDEFQGYYETEKRKLLGLARPTNELSYDERLRKGLGENYEQYKSLPWQFNNQGEMSLPTGFKLPGDEQGKAAEQQAKAEQKVREEVVKRYEKLRGQVNQETGQPISDADAQKQAIAEQMQAEQFRQSLSGGGSQAGQPPSAVPRIGGPTTQPAATPPQPTAAQQTQTQPAKPGLPLGNVISAAVSAGYTPVKTEKEAKTLKPGTRFVLPDGRTGTRK